MHAVRRELLELQAVAAGVPLWQVPLRGPLERSVLKALMRGVCERAVDEGVQAIAFGDLFLADIRAYREKAAHGHGTRSNFPGVGYSYAAACPGHDRCRSSRKDTASIPGSTARICRARLGCRLARRSASRDRSLRGKR